MIAEIYYYLLRYVKQKEYTFINDWNTVQIFKMISIENKKKTLTQIS